MLAYRHYFFNSLLGHYALYQLVVIEADRLADKNVFDDGWKLLMKIKNFMKHC